MTNSDLSRKIFHFCRQAGVQSVIVCAGARNAPLVVALQKTDFKIYHFFEERSASFFALGLIRSFGKPVAIITTSGTAVAEVLPAAIEATYQGLPLLILSADRPASYRGTGAPQSIEQVGLFSNYVERVYDLSVQSIDFNFKWSLQKPLHVNVCLDEPLIDQSKDDDLKDVFFQQTILQKVTQQSFSEQIFDNPLVVLGELSTAEQAIVVNFIQQSKSLVYAESLSQLRQSQEIQPYLLPCSDQLIERLFREKKLQSVIRFGRVPTLRFWRDLEKHEKTIPVLNVTDLPFSGLARFSENLNWSTFQTKYEQKKIRIQVDESCVLEAHHLGRSIKKETQRLLQKYPQSEQSFIFQLSKLIDTFSLYLGNSLPIRHWDQFAEACSKTIVANRGANGIDGQVSTYLGFSEGQPISYAVVGDLTALYDLAALGLSPQLQPNQRRLVVLNNFGGQIFSRVFKNELFINRHATQFKNWAEMWGWDYLKVQSSEQLLLLKEIKSEQMVIELQPEAEQTHLFWSEWDQICQKI